MSKRVVITGMGILTALGRGIDDTACAVRAGKSGISKITSFTTDRYKSDTGGEIRQGLIEEYFLENKGYVLDRASHLVLTACKDAFLNASLNTTNLAGQDISVFLGTTLGGMLSSQKFHRYFLLKTNKKERRLLLRDCLTNQSMHVAQQFGLIGEALVLNNACVSGLTTIGMAFRRLRSGQGSLTVAGGYDVMSEFTYAGFSSLQLVTQEKCRPFDKNRTGLALGEGAGVIVLEELGHALARNAQIYAEIIGFSQSTDAYHLTRPDPEAKGACNAIVWAIKDACISPGEIDYINAHGTGTLANDPMEAKAISMALGDCAPKVPVSSIKPMIGHTLGAAGAIDVIISTIAMKNQFLPVNLNYENPDPNCKLNIVSGQSKDAAIKVILSNSFGFGGSNGAILLRKFKR